MLQLRGHWPDSSERVISQLAPTVPPVAGDCRQEILARRPRPLGLRLYVPQLGPDRRQPEQPSAGGRLRPFAAHTALALRLMRPVG